MTETLILRDVVEEDLAHFFEHQRNERAFHMAAFTVKDPNDEAAFREHWRRICADRSVCTRTIVRGGVIVGHIASFEDEGQREITYWIAPALWGRGYASEAMRLFLAVEIGRPLYARAASDNLASLRVLEKHGFRPYGEVVSFANARNGETAETLLELL